MSLQRCPFCRKNNLLRGNIIAQTLEAYLVENGTGLRSYLIIPEEHVESPLQLSDTWWGNVKELMKHIPDFPAHYNVAMNIGVEAGQSVQHVHLWVISRVAGQRDSGKGLTRLIADVNAN